MNSRTPGPDIPRVPVLLADDDVVTRALVGRMLEDEGYDVILARDGDEAISILQERQVYLVITDWLMPGKSGIDVCRWIRSQDACHYVFVVMLTSQGDRDNVSVALDAGADEFIQKPILAPELRARLKSAQRMLSLVSRDVTIFALAELADSRDPETGDHLGRIRHYAHTLTQEMVHRGVAPGLPADYPLQVSMTAPLHDIGKVGIPDSILLKPGQLSTAEFEVMKTHTSIGARALDRAVARFPAMGYMRMARDIALTHHERWNGTGYPGGLKGEQIPLAGRIVALCDVYDALASKRVYKAAQPHHVARAEITRAAGVHFDPAIVESFLAVEEVFAKIAADADTGRKRSGFFLRTPQPGETGASP